MSPLPRVERMQILIGYDVETLTREGRRRLRRVAIACKDFGQRVQLSLFECSLSMAQLESLRYRLLEILDQETDSLRIYRLPDGAQGKAESYGRSNVRNLDEPLIL
jgi:CRISPR-associated protein Cas2